MFRGVAVQRGRGLGSILGGLMKNAIIPLAKTGIKRLAPIVRSAGRKAIRHGTKQLSKTLRDVGRGKTIEQAVADRIVAPTVKAVQRQLVQGTKQRAVKQTPSKRPASKRKRKPAPKQSAKRRRQTRDIFG